MEGEGRVNEDHQNGLIARTSCTSAPPVSTPDGSGGQLGSSTNTSKGHHDTVDDPHHIMDEGHVEEEDEMVSIKRSYLDSILKENKRLRKTLARAKGMFKNQWCFRSLQWKQMQKDLERLQKEEADLEGIVEEMKKVMGQVNREIGGREEEHRKLTERIRELREGKKGSSSSPPINLNQEEVMVTQIEPGRDSESKTAELIFPEEIWKMIFANLTSPKDLWNLCLTCPLFGGILSSWKAGWLLEQALPYLYRHLSGAKLLESRLVCKSWNSVIVNFLEDHPSLRPHSNRSDSDPRKLEFINPAIQLGLSNTINFHSNVDKIPLLDDPYFPRGLCQNPFIGRFVILYIGEDDYQLTEDDGEEGELKSRKLWERVYKFLETFGSEILYMSLDLPLECTEAAIARAHQFATRHVFQLVPNLRKLRVSASFDKTTVLDPASLPPAPNLETVESCTIAKDPISIALFTRHHLQLRKIHLTPEIWKAVSHLEWPHVTELYLDAIRGTGCFQSLGDELRMPNLTKLGLTLAFSPRFLDNDFTFNKLLNLIHRVSANTKLDTLRLAGHKMMMRGHPEYARSHCAPSTLKTLEIDHYSPSWTGSRGAPSYSFLVRCFPLIQNLQLFLQRTGIEVFEELQLGNDNGKLRSEVSLMPDEKCAEFLSRVKARDEIVEVNRYLGEGNMYKSNVWELLPQLNVFSFQWEVFSRNGYEEYLKKNSLS